MNAVLRKTVDFEMAGLGGFSEINLIVFKKKAVWPSFFV